METRLRLLMVEDNPDDAGLIQRTLERANFHIDTRVVSTEREFIYELDSFSPELILSDHQLPEFSSGQALQICRKKLPFVPFILVTGVATDEFAASIIKDGADDYILKSNLRRLPTAIKQAILKKRTEESLQKSEANLRTIFNSTDTGYVLLDVHLNVVSYNDFAALTLSEMNGTLQGGENLFSFLKTTHPGDAGEVMEKVLSGKKVEYETHFHAESNSWYQIRMLPVKSSEGNIQGINMAISNISERKKAEQELAVNEQRFRTLIENSFEAISLVNEKAEVLFFSKAAERMTGFSFQQRKDTPGSKIIHPDDLEKSKAVFKAVLDNPGKPFPFQARQLKKNGKYIWVEGVVTNLLHDKNVGGIVSNYRDVSERIEAQQNLGKALHRFEQAQQIAHLGHWEVDYIAKKTTWSDETFRIYGIEPGSVEPSRDLFLKYIHPEDLEMVKSIVEKGMQTSIPLSYYHRIVHKDGEVRSLFSVRQTELDQSGKPVRLYGVSLDITEITEKEKKLEQANKELETFIYKAYHDLRSPISTILGTVNVAKKEVSEELSLEYFTMIGEIAQKQNKMLLNLIKVMSIRDRELMIASFRMDDLLHDILESLQPTEGFERVQFTIDNQLDRQVIADRALVFDVIFYLTENSIQYADPGRPDCKIKIALNADDHGNILIEVEDNGTGISDDARAKVFDMFYRGNNLSKGSGLGLYLVKNAVEKLGGTIELVSEARTGCLFKVKVPVAS